MKTYLLEEMTWTEIREAVEQGADTVIICAASVEQHGPALPENTDTILGYAEASDLAKRLGNALADQTGTFGASYVLSGIGYTSAGGL